VADSGGRDFFISYTGVNRSWAEWIAVQLEAAGYTTVLQAWDFRPGSDFVHQMQQATSSAGRTLAVLSPAYFETGFGEAEWRAAFVKDPTGERGLLVPVRMQPCEPPVLGRPRRARPRRRAGHTRPRPLPPGDIRRRLRGCRGTRRGAGLLRRQGHQAAPRPGPQGPRRQPDRVGDGQGLRQGRHPGPYHESLGRKATLKRSGQPAAQRQPDALDRAK
jgi:hypothetical protein